MKDAKKKRITVIILLFGLIGLVVYFCLYYFVMFASWNYSADFLQAEQCLDYGGVWDFLQSQCWLAGQCEDGGGFWSAASSTCITENN